ncbi:hypothetical protein [Niastella populi]|uniref:Uncharacterized protein n=1 Tax=Niastella populi TaxID=550983 RepID=A0A1V9GC71_9BACT|nr:hypothetical protein [Niastella populi]OQP68281.1 hypothetical protein A4R26_00270 [Niastella populi]
MPNQHRIKIDLSHPNARNAEAFLNSWEEPFLAEENGNNQLVFRSTVSQTKVELFFFDSYAAADAYGMKHYNPDTEKRRWSLNGAMLFVISGEDVYKLQSLLSHFAGRE